MDREQYERRVADEINHIAEYIQIVVDNAHFIHMTRKNYATIQVEAAAKIWGEWIRHPMFKAYDGADPQELVLMVYQRNPDILSVKWMEEDEQTD